MEHFQGVIQDLWGEQDGLGVLAVGIHKVLCSEAKEGLDWAMWEAPMEPQTQSLMRGHPGEEWLPTRYWT